MESEESILNHHTNTNTKPIRFGPDPHQHQEYSDLTRNNTISIASDTHSYGQRDSRLHSIYDQYLSDPTETSIDHPLQRQASTTQHKPAAFSFIAQHTIRKDSLANSDIIEEMTSPTRYNHQIAPSSRQKGDSNIDMRNRESHTDTSAWAGMMTGNVDSDDSDSSEDSDDERIRKPTLQSSRGAQPALRGGAANSGASSRNSWTSRAAAVGSRPPDSASQNPPTLKLLGLKSIKEGGTPIGYNGSNSAASKQESNQQYRNPAFKRVEQEDKDRIVSTSDYGDELDRHDSFIEELDGKSNAPIFNTNNSPQKGQSKLQPPSSSSLSDNPPVSPRTALTQQLGLITPQIYGSSPHEQSRAPGGSDGYFPPQMTPSSSSGDSSSNHSQTRILLATQPTSQRAPPPVGLSIPPPSQAAIPLQRNQPQSPLYPPSSPNYGPVPPPARNGSLRGVIPAPMPIPLPSPVYPQAPTPNMYNGGPLQNPGFSDTPQIRQMRRQPSLLRRSMAFIKGIDPMGMPQSSQYNQQARQGDVGNGQRRSLFRRSMAFLSGKPMPPMQMQQAHDSQHGLQDESDTPQPRVAGFLDEKPKSRKSEYLGGGGIGDEWDYTGTGARFWKRFSMAQRKEQLGANKDSEEFRRKTERRRKWIMYLSLLGGICIIGAVIGIVIWRESVATSSIPGALDREHNGVNPGQAPLVANTLGTDSAATSTVANTNTAQAATTTSRTRKHHNNTAKRSLVLATSSPLMAEFVRDVIAKAAPIQEAVHPLPRGEPLWMSRSKQRRHLQHARNANFKT